MEKNQSKPIEIITPNPHPKPANNNNKNNNSNPQQLIPMEQDQNNNINILDNIEQSSALLVQQTTTNTTTPEFNIEYDRWYHDPQNWVRICIVVVLITCIIFAFIKPSFSYALLTFFLSWVENNPWDGAFVMVIAYVICSVLLIPGSILSLGAGIIYSHTLGFWAGVFFGTLVIAFSCFLGSCIGFLNGRYLFRSTVTFLIRNHPKFQLIDQAVRKNGFKVVFLFRLSPVTPYAAFNYLMGITAVDFGDYCLGAIGMLPNVFSFVYLGASIRNIYDISEVNPENSEYLMVITVIGVILISISITYFFYIARQELDKIAKEVERESMMMLTEGIEHMPLNNLEHQSSESGGSSNDDSDQERV